jgi:hypothetical protein
MEYPKDMYGQGEASSLVQSRTAEYVVGTPFDGVYVAFNSRVRGVSASS